MITTTELHELLNKTTPAPWYVSLAPEYIGAPEEHSVVFVDSVSNFIASTHLPPTEQRALDDAALIALAPKLAAEVIRLREGIKALIKEEEEYSNVRGNYGDLYSQGQESVAARFERSLRALLNGEQS